MAAKKQAKKPVKAAPKKKVAKKAPEPKAPPEKEIERLRESIADDEAKIHALEHPIQEFPKMVNGLTVENAEQEAAVKAGTAKVVTVKSAQGDIVEVK